MGGLGSGFVLSNFSLKSLVVDPTIIFKHLIQIAFSGPSGLLTFMDYF